jgi:hypothetical protein
MTNATPAFPTLLVDDETLFRALRNKAQQDDKRRAFLLRSNEKDTGLSVSYNCSPDDCENELEKKSYGVLSMTPRQVTALNSVHQGAPLDLSVVPDAPQHANIKGIPHEDDNADLAWWIAGQLSGLATTIREGLKKLPSP